MTLEIHPDADELAIAIAARISARLAQIQSEGRTPSLVLTGGTIATQAYRHLEAGTVDWTDVDLYWGDERFVEAGHDDRNDQQAREAFLERLGVPAGRVHAAPPADGPLGPSEAAEAYAAMLPSAPFDLVLLGVGPDGHIASLFPGHPLCHETDRRVAEILDSPKPPPARLTLTFPALNHAESVWLLVSGEGKAEAVRRAFAEGTVDDTPVVGVQGRSETVWLMDAGAASGVTV